MPLSEFQFEDARYLWVASLCLPLAFLARHWAASAWQKLRLFAGKSRDPRAHQKNPAILDRRTLLGLGALVCFALALARPQANPEIEEREGQALDIIVLLDVSKSMAAEDLYPNRLGKAKRTISSLLTRLGGDRVGLVAFAGSAVLVSPLTSDYEIIRTFLFALGTDTIENQGTNIGAAMQVAMDAFRRGSEREINPGEKSHVLLLLSDGEMTVGETTEALAELKKNGIMMHAIAIGGDKGAPIPIRDKSGTLVSYKQDRRGNPVLSVVDAATLEKLATETGGTFFPSTSDDSEVSAIVASLANLNRAPTKNLKTRIYSEFFVYPLLAGFLLLLLSYLPPLRGFRASLRVVPLGLFLLTAPASPAVAADSSLASALWSPEKRKAQAGVKSYSEEKYGDAAETFKGLQAENPDSPELGFNTGTALIKEGKVDAGRAILEETASSLGKNTVAGALARYNLAGSYAEAKQYDQALEQYAILAQQLRDKPERSKAEEQLLGETSKRIEQIARAQQQQQQQQQQQPQNKQDQDKEKQDDNKKEKGSDNNSQSDQSKSEDQESQEQDKKNDKGEADKEKRPENQRYDFERRKKFKENEVLSERDAQRILEALKQQEQLLQKKLLQQKTISRQQPNPGDKDW